MLLATPKLPVGTCKTPHPRGHIKVSRKVFDLLIRWVYEFVVDEPDLT